MVGLGALHGTPLDVANTALTSQLTMSAVGVLVGGMLASYTTRHGLVAACGLMMTATACMLVGLIDFPAFALVLMMATAGFCSGMTMPSRDLIVRAVTPPGAYGRVFGFVSTGFNIAGIVSPTIFGQFPRRPKFSRPRASTVGGSSNGRTADSDSVNLGSNPSPPAST